MPEDLEQIKKLFDDMEPGAGKALERYLASAEEAYESRN